MNLKGCIVPGSTAANATTCRVSIIRVQSGAAFTANMSGSYSPIVTGSALQLYYDKFYAIPAYAGPGFPVNLNISVKINHKQKFSGTGAGTQTGDSVYVVIQSVNPSGTTAPALQGVMEIFFDPM